MRLLANHRTYAVLAALVLAAVVFFNGLGTFYTDIKPEIYIRPWAMLVHYMSSWTSSPYLGSPNFNVGLVPVLAVLSAFRGIGMSPEFAFKTFHFILLMIAAFGASTLVRKLAPKVGVWGGLAAALFYIANPYTITAGATLAIALPMAFLPWLLWAMANGLQRPTSWAWPALVGVSFFLMSGMNVAVVPVFGLLAIIPLIIAVWRDYGLDIRDSAIVLGRSALFVVLLSMYWLVPAAMALGTGAQIVEGSETLDGIAKVSSLPEILRGLGLWPLYGSNDVGPWVPEHAVYLTSPFIMVLSMLWPTLGLLALVWAKTRLRIFIAFSVLISTVIMVGVFPSEESPASPFGYLLRELLNVPILSAFRTTNKIGAVLSLALALGIAALLVYWLPRLWKIVPLRASLAVAMVTVFVAWTLPAFTGGLYISPMNIPEYWEEAAASIDKSEQPGTVLVLPGQVRPNYRWTEERPDDVLNSVLDRRAVLPETTPNASPPAVNFLAALDGSFQSGTSTEDVVSGMARYLGAGQVLLRHDVVWETQGGARPAQTSRQVGADPGLFGRENFGKEGQYVLSPAMEDPFFFGEQFLPPLQVYDVQGTVRPVRALPLDRGVIVAGDGFAFPQMLSADMLGSTPLIRYAQDISTKDFATALSQSERLVMTDTNARRNVIPNRLTAGQGPLLRANDKLGTTRTLGTNPDDQTVREDEVISVKTTQSGGVFFDLPYGSGKFAFDGDLATAWRFGDFGTGEGQSITATFDEPTQIDTVSLAQMKVGPVTIDEIEVSAGGKKVTSKLPEIGIHKVDLGGVEAKNLTVKIKSLKGEGFNFVALSEINVNGLRSETVARMPLTFQNHYEKLDAEGKTLFAQKPLDVLMERVQNTTSIDDDSETVLDRRMQLPDARTFAVDGDIRVRGDVEAIYDLMDGFDPGVKVISSGYYFDNLLLRASSAADGKSSTAWVPGGGTRDAWWEIQTAQRRIDGVTITQERQESGQNDHHHASRVEILVDNQTVTEANIGLGENRITFDSPVSGSNLRIRIVGLEGDPATLPPRFTEINTGTTVSRDAGAVDQCIAVATIDGAELRMKPSTERLAKNNQAGTAWESCGDVDLAAGSHRVRQNGEFVIDRLHFADVQETTNRYLAAPVSQVLQDSNSRKQIQIHTAVSGYAVVNSQGVNPNWRASINGRDLGPAQTLNGYSSGWIIPEGTTGVITMEYLPQRWSWVAMAVSFAMLLAAIGFVGMAVWRRELFAVATPLTRETKPWPKWLSRPVLEGGFIALSGFFGGFGGLAAAAIFVAGTRTLTLAPKTWIYAGAGAVFASILSQLAVLIRNDVIGKVSADAISLSLWPHWIAFAGLVWILAGVVLLVQQTKEVAR